MPLHSLVMLHRDDFYHKLDEKESKVIFVSTRFDYAISYNDNVFTVKITDTRRYE